MDRKILRDRLVLAGSFLVPPLCAGSVFLFISGSRLAAVLASVLALLTLIAGQTVVDTLISATILAILCWVLAPQRFLVLALAPAGGMYTVAFLKLALGRRRARDPEGEP